MAIGLNTDTAFIISKHGSPLSQLTSGAGAGKIKYLRGLWNAPDMYNQVGWDLRQLKNT